MIIYLILDIMALEIILLMLTYYGFGNYFEKFCVSLLNYSCHISIFEDETYISPTPLIVLLTGLCLILLFYILFRVGDNLLRQLFGG